MVYYRSRVFPEKALEDSVKSGAFFGHASIIGKDYAFLLLSTILHFSEQTYNRSTLCSEAAYISSRRHQ
jgi:hypothetical protein